MAHGRASSDGNEPVPIEELEDPASTPPAPMRGRAVLRALAIVAVFVFAGSVVYFIRSEGYDHGSASVRSWWQEPLVVPGFVMGVLVAGGDYVWRRRRD